MKWNPATLCLLFLALSCSKKNGPSNGSSGTSYLSSAHAVSPRAQVIDSLSYDQAHHLVTFTQYDFDTTSGSPLADSITVTFTFSNGAALPDSYTWTQLSTGVTADPHVLTFDGQNRVTKDTSLSGSGYVGYFSYPNGNLAATILFDGTLLNNQVDTVFLAGGNMGTFHIYYPNNAGTADSLNGAVQYTFSSYANPSYQADVAGSFGILLNNLCIDGFGGWGDFISKNVVHTESGVGSGLTGPVTLNATTDASGRVVLLTEPGLAASSYNIHFYYY